jgi:hypothetical protein
MPPSHRQKFGSVVLTKEEADKLSGLGLLAHASHHNALNQMQALIGAALGTYGGIDLSDAEVTIAEQLHNSFMDDAGKNRLTQLKELLAKVKELSEDAEHYAG